MYQQYRLPGSKRYLVHTCYIPFVVEWILAYMAKFGVPWCPETKALSGRLWFYGSLVPALNEPAISAPWVKGLFGKHMFHTLCCGMNFGVYDQFGIPWFAESKASLWQIMILWQSGPCTLRTSNIGSLGQRAIWYTHVTYPLLWNEYWHTWPSLWCLCSQKRRRPSGRLRVYRIPDPAPYVPAMSAPWVKGLFRTHMFHTLCCGMNIGVLGQVLDALVPRNEGVPLADCDLIAFRSLHPMYQQYRLPVSKGYLVHICYIPSFVEWILAYMAQAWGALVPRNEGVPLADCDFMAVWTLHPMHQQYRLPGSKGYLVNTCYIPSVGEWILAYMIKFGMPWIPEWKASLWQIVILWQSGPCTLCTSNIGSLGQRAIWYTHVTYPLLWNEYWRIWPSLGCLGSQKRRRPSGRLWFFGNLDRAPYVPATSAPWVKRLFGTHMLHTLYYGMNIGVYGQVWGSLVPRNEVVPLADCDFMGAWTLHPTYQQYRLPGSTGYLVRTCYITSAVEWILAYMAKFGVPWFPGTKASLWQIVIFWQSGPCTLCTSNIGSLGQRAIWYTHVTYPLLWNEYWRKWNKFGVPWFPETKASLWQIMNWWQSGHCILCTSNIGSLGQGAIWYTHVTYPLLWNEYWRIWPSLGCLGAQKRRRPSGRLWFYGSLVPALNEPAISAPWVKGLFGKHMFHTLCCGMNFGVYDQVLDSLVPRIKGVPLADYDFMAVWSLPPAYKQYRLLGSKGYLVHTCYIPSVVEWILAYMA